MVNDYNVALFLHLLGVLLLVSGIVVAGAAHTQASRRRVPGEIAALLVLARAGVLLAAPGVLLVVGAGVWLVNLEDDIGMDTGWLQAALGLFVVAMVLGALGGQQPKRARLLAQSLEQEGGPVSVELEVLLEDRRARYLNSLSALAMLGILALMVFKP
jgi:uncharacterized membrane protein